MDEQMDEPAECTNNPQRKKRTLPPQETNHNGNSSSSLHNQNHHLNNQKGETSPLDDGSAQQKRQQRRLSSSNDVSQIRNVKLARIRLEAIFHPKFENESSERDVRREMLQKVGREGYLEVTLKHSGSLLLWSGGSRYYSKNDANNMVTLVGEYLLRHHMILVWGEAANGNDNSRSKYDECSDYLQQHGLTLAFEIVTSVLGDHGDVPKQPYLILLSVANKKHQQFHTSSQLIKFATTFRLPHNDYWMFTTQSSCTKLFQFYDDIREIGTAESVVKGLDQLIDFDTGDDGPRSRRIVSMYPHLEYQGNILEGLVVRFVPYEVDSSDGGCNNVFFQSLNELAEISETNLEIMTNARATDASIPNLTDFFGTNRQAIDSENELRSFLKHQNPQDYQRLVRATGTERKGEWEVSSLILSSLKEDAGTMDNESKQIVQLIKTLIDLGVKVEYKLYRQCGQQDESAVQIDSLTGCSQQERWVCIVHVIHDETFKKYSNNQTPDAMQLFRGFSFELVFGESCDIHPETEELFTVQPPAATESRRNNLLMLKMKFLPYMVRTFGCRNGLKILSRSGIDVYECYTLDLLKRWGMSHNAIKQWQPYFYNWGLYAESILKQQNGASGNKKGDAVDNRQLSESSYLKHLMDFDCLYHSGQLTHVTNEKAKIGGLIVIVSANRNDSSMLGDFFSSKLGIRSRFDETGSISEVDVLSSLRSAALCNTVIVDSQAPLKKLLKTKEYAEAMYVVLFGCSQEDINQEYEVNKKDNKRASGMIKSWGHLRCKQIFQLSKMPLLEIDESKEVADVLARLEELSASRSKGQKLPGILVYFPGIPGCGKSSICGQDTSKLESTINQLVGEEKVGNQKMLSVTICEGDRVKGKYWPHVLLERLRKTESIYLADKNATPIVWGTIDDICSKSLALPAPVIPDSMALSTVKVKHPEAQCCYPYSLAYLAVCMLRVLMRPKKSHAGSLDESTENAMMVVVKFYCLYRDLSAESMLAAINRGRTSFSNASNSSIVVPFFNEANLKHLPQDLHEVLVDALHMQYSIDHKKSVSQSDLASMEARLRNLLTLHKSFLESMCVKESESRESFVKQVSQLASTLTDSNMMKSLEDAPKHKFIEIASIDIDRNIIHSVLENYANDYIEVKQFLTRIGGMPTKSSQNQEAFNGVDIVTTCKGSFVEKTHVTMAHFSQLSQQNILQEFSQFNEQPITVTITSILMGDSVAAFAVKLPEHLDSMPQYVTSSCNNSFPHITIWVGTNESAARSNDLPVMVENKEAVKVDFAQGIAVSGKFGLWYI